MKVDVFLKRGEDVPFEKEKGVVYRHFEKNLWNGRAKHDATHFYAPSFKDVSEVYGKAGKQEYGAKPKVEVKKEEPVREAMTFSQDIDVDVEVGDVQESKHWSELSWPKMRSLATDFTDEPIKSKEQAKEILAQAESEGKI